jgi:hypothetical protein
VVAHGQVPALVMRALLPVQELLPVSLAALQPTLHIHCLQVACTSPKLVTVNPLPAAIGGTNNVCVGLTTTLTDATGSSTWSSSNTANATIGTRTGIVTGVASDAITITFTHTCNRLYCNYAHLQ